MHTDIVIYASNKKIKLILFACFLICLLGLFIIFGLEGWEISFFGLIPVNKVFLGSSLLVFFGIFIFLLYRKMNNKTPIITINSKSIIDQSSYTSVGEINLIDIIGIGTKIIAGQNYLLIKVKNPVEYIERQKPGIKKKLLEVSFKNNGTPIVLNAVTLTCSYEELYAAIQSKIKV